METNKRTEMSMLMTTTAEHQEQRLLIRSENKHYGQRLSQPANQTMVRGQDGREQNSIGSDREGDAIRGDNNCIISMPQGTRRGRGEGRKREAANKKKSLRLASCLVSCLSAQMVTVCG